jgi:allophanate hydrolase
VGWTLVEVDAEPFLEAGRLLYEAPWVAERDAAVGAFIARHPGAVDPIVAAIVRGAAGQTATDASGVSTASPSCAWSGPGRGSSPVP